MQEILSTFQEFEDPPRGQRQGGLKLGCDLNELLPISLLSTLAGGRMCVDMEDYGRA